MILDYLIAYLVVAVIAMILFGLIAGHDAYLEELERTAPRWTSRDQRALEWAEANDRIERARSSAAVRTRPAGPAMATPISSSEHDRALDQESRNNRRHEAWAARWRAVKGRSPNHGAYLRQRYCRQQQAA